MASTKSFSRSTFAKLSPHSLLLATLSAESAESPSRSNGRAAAEARPVNVQIDSLSHADGSALVRVGDTAVICGVRGEYLQVTKIPQYRPQQPGVQDTDGVCRGRGELRDYDLLVPNIELATGCAPQFLPGVPPTSLAQTMSTRLYSLLHACALVHVDELKIWADAPAKSDVDEDEMVQDGDDDQGEERRELKAYWVLHIDLLFISYDGNPFDAAWAATLTALRNTKLPVARWDADREAVVCSPTENFPLTVSGLPIACTAVVFMEKERGRGGGKDRGRGWLLVDPDRLEESLCKETVTVVVDRRDGKTRLRGIEKQGGTFVDVHVLKEFALVAESRWEEFCNAIKKT